MVDIKRSSTRLDTYGLGIGEAAKNGNVSISEIVCNTRSLISLGRVVLFLVVVVTESTCIDYEVCCGGSPFAK